MSAKSTAATEAELPPVRITQNANGCMTMQLQRPKALNSLSLPMVRLLTEGLKAADKNQSRYVLVYGEGEKAFCAGGDIRALAFPEKPTDPSHFFREEYTLNHMISQSKAPYVAIMRGITMGGGVGISVHGNVRIITDNTMFAMPETGIGLFPDVGGTYFLPKLGAIGMYLALTGQSLGARDTLLAGVGTHFIPLAQLPSFIHAAESQSGSLDDLLNQYATSVPAEKPDAKLKPFLADRADVIKRVFTFDSYDQVLNNLKVAHDTSKDEGEKKWLHDVQKQLSHKSPTSLMITFQAMKLGASGLSLAECLEYEFRVASRISLEGANGDFAEGVKAVLIDKKHKPQWKPFRTQEEIKETYFAPLQKELGIEELQLPKK